MKFRLGLYSFAIYMAFGLATFADDNRAAFFEYLILGTTDEFSFENFELGDSDSGTERRVQIQLHNPSTREVVFKPGKLYDPNARFTSTTTTIPPKSSTTVHAVITIPQSNKKLSRTFRLECFLGEMRLTASFNTSLCDVASFAQDSWQYYCVEGDIKKNVVAIPLILSPEMSSTSVRVRIEDQLGFLTPSISTNPQGSSIVELSFFPNVLENASDTGKIFLEDESGQVLSEIKLLIFRRSVVELMQDRLVFKYDATGEELVAETMVRCQKGTLSDLSIVAEIAQRRDCEVEIREIRPNLGRVYFKVKGKTHIESLLKQNQVRLQLESDHVSRSLVVPATMIR